MGSCCLRRVKWEDREMLYHWRNDAVVRHASFQSKEISLSMHEHWLQEKLGDPFSRMYILEIHGIPVGQVRLDRQGNEADISYSIASDFRGRGYGKILLRMVEQEARKESLVLVGKVKKDNLASQAVFRSLGYEERELEKFFEYRKRAMAGE